MTAASVAPGDPGVRPGGPLLVCEGVDAGYGSLQVLFDVDLEMRSGEILAVLGANGAGKSTLLRTIVGAVQPTRGAVHFAGRDMKGSRPVAAPRAGLALVAGGSTTFPTLTVAEHFRVGTWLPGRTSPPEEIDDRVAEVLELFPSLGERWTTRGGDLSGGEQQQLALALAFVARPTLLMIDELSLGLAPIVVTRLLDDVRELHRRGTSVLIVEQSVNVALEIADRACVMEKGVVGPPGAAAELRDNPDVVHRQVFHLAPTRLAEGLDDGDRGSGGGGGPATGGTAQEEAGTPTGPVPRKSVLSVSGLSCRFGGIMAVHQVSLDTYEGEVLGLVGPNGAGKTTVFDLVSGFLAPTGGVVTLDGTDITAWPPHRRVQAGVGRSFQDSRLFTNLTVAQNVALGLDRHLEHRDMLAALFNAPAVQEMEERLHGEVGALLDRLGLEPYRDVPAGELPTGIRRLVDLAMVVALEPRVVLLDEPSSGVAQHETGSIEAAVAELRASRSCAVLIIEHDMGLLRRVSDELVAMDQGELVVRGAPDTVLTDPRIVESYLGPAGRS